LLEKIVENWLTSSGEREFEVPFTQVLIAEGYRVLQGPSHHPFEHGKDIVAYSLDKKLFAFQLKGGDLDLKQLESIQHQLFALVATPAIYPGIPAGQRPDRAVLVVNGALTPPARNRLAALNSANEVSGLGVIEVIERHQLVGRFLSAHALLPALEPETLSRFLDIFLSDGQEAFPVNKFLIFISDALRPAESAKKARRIIANAVLLAAYAMGPWQKHCNHLAVAQGWLATTIAVLGVPAKMKLAKKDFESSYHLALGSARRSLNYLLEEALIGQDLVIPDIADGFVYGMRTMAVCSYSAAFLLSESFLRDGVEVSPKVRELLLREIPYFSVVSESQAPQLFIIATALERLGQPIVGANLVFGWLADLAENNQPHSSDAIPNPYYPAEEVTLWHAGGAESPEERFAGVAYSLHLSVDWLARRAYREPLEQLWSTISKVEFFEFEPSSPAMLLSANDTEGSLRMWRASTPQSWASLHAASRLVDEGRLPKLLWRHPECLPYLGLILPAHFTSSIGKAIDYYENRCDVTFSDD
jgi:hypothetical protein